MRRAIDLAALSRALRQFEEAPFPEHPNDDGLDDWVLELAELEGYIVGLAKSARGSRRSELIQSSAVARHLARLNEIVETKSDEAVRDYCLRYVGQLKRIEDVLGGREE